MTKKDYEMVADGINKAIPWGTAAHFAVVEELVNRFSEDNPRFDPDKFREACSR